MSVTALFRGFLQGQKTQETPEKPPAVIHTGQIDDDEDEERSGGFKNSGLRNSRFYRSMRKKKQTAAEPSDSKTFNLYLELYVLHL